MLMISILSSAIITLALLMLFLKTPAGHFALDRPNYRSLHDRVVPRTGGLAIMLGTLSAWWLQGQSLIWILSSLFLVIVSLADDIHDLTASFRFAFQLCLAAVTLYFMIPEIGICIALMLLGVVWMTNLYNFMDGSDGLAGGMAVIGFGVYAIAASLAGDGQLVALCATISSACSVFLIFNFYPARIFMGDAGSIPLGFLAGALGIFGWQHNVWPLWFPILVFSAFILDASLTLVKRAIHREKVWEAHRSHYYQRLVQIGWGHRKTALAEYALMLATSGSALILLRESLPYVATGLVTWLLIYTVLAYATDRAWKSFNSR